MPDAHAPPPDPAPPGTTTATLFDLVATCLDRMEQRGPAALDELCREHPRHAERLRARIAQLGAFGLAGAEPSDGVPERLGQFRLIARLGGGGMGVVYEAEQDGLQRRVALKLVRPETIYFPGARERFRREVEVLARLQHPGIVPVYAGGEERGVPYLAMELVRGATLEEALRELPSLAAGREPARLLGRDLLDAVQAVVARRGAQQASHASGAGSTSGTGEVPALFAGSWVVACTRIARRVAEALVHAQGQGVLHRDIKPSNVMLTPEGRVLLLDFGLASAEGSVRLTASAQGLGSPAYMSPEQVRGERDAVDARSDVWSLGVTLYEALTLHQPFATNDLQHTARLVLAAHPPALRTRNAAIPADLETVVLAALEREPARRYPGPAELARDLSNVLELRPITVRPPGAARRLLRWTQRRPARATACALGGLLLVAGPLGWELKRRQSMDTVLAARDQAERNFQAALGAIGHVLRGYATEGLEDVPRMQRAQLAAIDRALELFPELERDRPDDETVLAERAELHLSRGDILRDLGRTQDALPEFEEVIALRRRLAAAHDDGVHITLLAAALDRAAKVRFALGRPAESLPLYTESIALMRRAVAGDERDTPAAKGREPRDTPLAHGSESRDESPAHGGEPRDAPPAHEDGVGGEVHGHPAWRRDLALGLANLAEALRGVDRPAEARTALEESHALARRLHDDDPADADTQWLVGRVCGDLATLLRLTGDPSAALPWARSALEANRAAHATEPDSRYYTFDVALAGSELAHCLDAMNRIDESETEAHASLALMDGLLHDYPDVLRYHDERSLLLELLGVTAARSGRTDEAAALLAQRVAETDELCRLDPGRSDLAFASAQALNNLVAVRLDGHVHAGEHGDAATDESLALIDRGEARLRAAVAKEPGIDASGRLRAVLAYSRARVLLAAGRMDAARGAVESFESAAGDDAFRLRYAADLWNETLLSLQGTDAPPADGAAAAPDRNRAALGEAKSRMYALLGRAIDAGFADASELATTPSLDGFRDEPEFKALVARLPASP